MNTRLTPPFPPDPIPELLTDQQAATFLGFSRATVRRMEAAGLMPAMIKIGLGLRPMARFRLSELHEWLAAGCPSVR